MNLSYAVVTPVRDEAENIRRLAHCLAEQTVRPRAWVIVDNGSVDDSLSVARELAFEHKWLKVTSSRPSAEAVPGAPVVRAFNVGLREIESIPDVVVKLDADTSMASDYFERQLRAFSADPRLGISSGTCYEESGGQWVRTFATGSHVRGAARAYRRECLEEVAPLEERMGWDGLDALKANVLGWKTGVLEDLAFYHHRQVGARDGGRHKRWSALGEGAYYMGYRFWYLALRALHHARRDPAALAMIGTFVASWLRRRPRCADPAVRAHLRETQTLRNLPARAREALGKTGR